MQNQSISNLQSIFSHQLIYSASSYLPASFAHEISHLFTIVVNGNFGICFGALGFPNKAIREAPPFFTLVHIAPPKIAQSSNKSTTSCGFLRLTDNGFRLKFTEISGVEIPRVSGS